MITEGIEVEEDRKRRPAAGRKKRELCFFCLAWGMHPSFAKGAHDRQSFEDKPRRAGRE